MRRRVSFEQWVAFPVETVFRFLADPGNLPRIMPPETETHILAMQLVPAPGRTETPIAGPGSRIVTSFRLVRGLPFHAEWVARITEFEWNSHFADEQEKGPFRYWKHRHEVAPERRDGVDGSRVRDLIEFDPGWGPLGDLVSAFFLERQLRQTFAYRQRVLEDLLRS
jgi:ligand-binding SRPBCC domain-containing protein